MSRKSKIACKNCVREALECDMRKPQCRRCALKGVRCNYPLTLHWGGRPYKNKEKRINIPSETSLVNGVLKVKKKGVFLDNKNKSRGFILVSENFAPKKIEDFSDEARLRYLSAPEDELGVPRSDAGIFDISSRNFEEVHLVDNCTESPTTLVSYNQNMVQQKNRFFFPFENDQIVNEQLEVQIPDGFISPPPSLPVFAPAVDFLKSREEYWKLFDFYMNKTSHLFVVLSCEGYRSNPFRTILPRMAMHSITLMKLLLAFSGQHRRQLQLAAEGSKFTSLDENLIRNCNERLPRVLLEQSTNELIERLANADERLSDLTLANILMFASYSLYICDGRSRWRTHFYGAKGILISKLQRHENGQNRVIYLRNEEGPYPFLQRWFAYMNVIGVLSSPNLASQHQYKSDLKFDFTSVRKGQSLRELRRNFDDIEYSTGMEIEVLSLLASASDLVIQKERQTANSMDTRLIADAIELDYEILEHLERSEKERDSIWAERKEDHAKLLTDLRVKNYFLLRTTNLIYGLTGVLQLRRRVVEMPQDCKLVQKLLFRITNLIDKEISPTSSSLCCIIFCLFSCGCELLGASMIPLRDIYLDRLNALEENGVGCATSAKAVMRECWKTKKFWWNIMQENNLDISFAI